LDARFLLRVKRATGKSALPSRTEIVSPACHVRQVPNSDLISTYHPGMTGKMAMLAVGLLLMPIKANGQSSDAEIIGPTPFRVAEPARWRDGYINWRGRKIFGPDWQVFKAENGAAFVIDMKSVVNISRTNKLIRVVAYLVEEDNFYPSNLMTFAFNCKDFVEVVTKVPLQFVQAVQQQARVIACS
jgi:hypothetical protein